MSEALRALAAIADRPEATAGLVRALRLPRPPSAAAHTALFVLELPPYASVYLGPEGMVGGVARDRVAGLFRALEALPPPEPDHLAVLLHAAADLAERESASPSGLAARQARAALLREHVLSWAPVYLAEARLVAEEPYRAWARLLSEALVRQARDVGPGEGLPQHLAEAPALPPVDGLGASDLVDALLTPVRTGMVVTRSALAEAAADLGLGLRVGERRYVLRSLVGQAPAATLDWLSRRAEAAAERHAAELHPFGPIGAFWQGRARGAAGTLRELAAAARRGVAAGDGG